MKKTLIVAIALAMPAVAAADGSPWLPIPGSAQVSIGYLQSSGDEYDAGTTRKMLSAKIEQGTFSLGLQLGLTDQFAIDTRFNYVDSKFGMASEGALSDTTIGARWRVVDEFEHNSTPTVTLRANAILNGNYDTGRRDAIGDGGSGGELSVLVGKYLMPALTVNGELGYRNRNKMIPSDFWGDINVGYAVHSRVSLTAGYSMTRSQGDLDIGGPGFTPSRFPETTEDRDVIKVGASIAAMSNMSVNLNYGKVVSGRNSTLADLFGVSLAASF